MGLLTILKKVKQKEKEVRVPDRPAETKHTHKRVPVVD